MIAFMCGQYTTEWWALRAGVPTASEFDRILTGLGKRSTSWPKYLAELLAQWRAPAGNAFSENGRIGTPAMAHGRATEPEARGYYAMQANANVLEVGFVLHDSCKFGCSPDGLVGPGNLEPLPCETLPPRFHGSKPYAGWTTGGLELKCPEHHTQVKYLARGDQVPTKYRPQVHGQLIVTGAQWWDFVSYAKGAGPTWARVEPDSYTQTLKQAVADFVGEYDDAKAKALLETRI